MAEQICPVCGCSVIGAGYEKEDGTCCCEPCASSTSCGCSCCSVAEKPEEKNG